MAQHPEQLGFIFHPSDDMPTETNFDCAITKFGYKKVFEAFEACTHMHRADEVCATSNLYPFMIAASYEKSALSIIYYLVRRHPSLLDHTTCTRTHAYNEKKRKRSILGPGEQR